MITLIEKQKIILKHYHDGLSHKGRSKKKLGSAARPLGSTLRNMGARGLHYLKMELDWKGN